MNDPANKETVGDDLSRRRPLRKTALRSIAALPTIVTLMNGTAGFASVHYATKTGLGNTGGIGNLMIASWLIFAALLFDALDGRVARMTRRATDFGALLDSLCDIISFGVAPAILMVHAVAMTREIPDFEIFASQASHLGKAVMVIAVIYLCCSILRLARFTVENAPDLLHHMYFKGLPSPAAAVLVAAMVLLFGHIQNVEEGLKSARWLNITVGVALPAATLAVAILMVTRFRYPHLVNRFVIGRKPFSHIVLAVGAIASVLMFGQFALPLAAITYAASGPVAALWEKSKLSGKIRNSGRRPAVWPQSKT
ncbi:MAG: CDP-alcohol phosphatidyltransferase family protein [Planctomycetota bacterium]|nr:CDP-alcohol phosphatidyltransferase family protein [Planctomycetota bacterium]